MHRYCTSTNPGPSVPEDDGRSLLAMDQYRVEVQGIDRLSVAQEYELVDWARAGCEQAKVALIESCLHYTYALAWHYVRKHSACDHLDLVQAASEAIVEHIDEALRSRYTCAFLRVVARCAMVQHCFDDHLIRVPRTSYARGRRAPLTVSLATPLNKNGDDGRTLLDVLEDANWQELEAVAV